MAVSIAKIVVNLYICTAEAGRVPNLNSSGGVVSAYVCANNDIGAAKIYSVIFIGLVSGAIVFEQVPFD